LGIGSNLGERRTRIEEGIAALEESGVRILHRASLYETEPVGIADQPWFLNTVVAGETAFAPRELLELCKTIEKTAGRIRTVRFGPRLLDIDILLFKGLVVHEEDLDIPHPRMHVRRFVLVPLLEIAPSIRNPRDGRQYAEILAGLDEGKKVTKLRAKEF
jgi:2-amino-4-hydroxy-6-hydroxymethyldihydropteridine diphosphokinase